MYSILVVEDEKWIRKGIVRKLEKSDITFSNIYDAKDGQEALDIMEKNNVDIIITDICMPDIDGLELIRRIKKLSGKTEFIIVSGYSEFKYAEQAINMGVKSYLLKPTKEEDLKNALIKVIENLEEKKQYDSLSKENKDIKTDNNRLIIEKELNLLLRSKNCFNIEALKKVNPNLFNKGFYQLLILNMDHDALIELKNDGKDINTRIIEFLHKKAKMNNYHVFNNIDRLNQIYILIWGDKNKIQDTCNKICKKCLFVLINKVQINITIGKSNIIEGIKDELYKSAKKAIDLRLIYGQNKVYNEDAMDLTNDFIFPKTELKLLHKFILLRDLKNIKIILSEIFAKERYKKSSIDNLYFVYSEVINSIYQSLYAINKDINKVIKYDISNYSILDFFNNIEDITTYLFKVIEDTIKSRKNVSVSCRELVEQAVKYIDIHYAEKMNLKSLSAQFGINADYFSSIFKKELGITFTKYLATLRLNHACRMLKETDISIEEIAKSVGYSDLQYFYRVFKKEFNYTPMEFRSRK